MMPEDNYERQARERFGEVQQKVRQSEEYSKWKSLTPVQRRVYVIAGSLIVALLCYLVYVNWGIPGIYPKGEGG